MVNSSIGKILVVDDEVELKNILVEALTSQGYETSGFTSGEEALAALRGEAFDVLLTDLMMPGMDGITLVRESLQIDPYLVAIVMTGRGTIQTAVDAMKVGAFDYVLKPFRLQTMLPVLTRAMNARHLRLENVQLREAVAIHELSQTIAFTLDPQTVLSKLADAALHQSEADEVSVLLPTADGAEFFVAAVRGEKRERLLGERVPFGASISGWVARQHTPVILNGEVNDDRFVALWPRPDISSSISIPMLVAKKLVGVLNLNVVDKPRPFTLGQMKALTILAGTAAAALESASLYTQVQQAEENYRSIFENAIEGVFRGTPDGLKFFSVNPAMAKMFGYDSPAEMVKAVVDITRTLGVKPERRDAALRRLSEQGGLKNLEERVQRKDGSEIWISANVHAVSGAKDELLYLDGIVQDITERKKAEAAQSRLIAEIREQRERLDTIVATVPGVVFESWGQPNSSEHRTDFVSDYVQAMLGYSAEEWLSIPGFWFSIVHPDDRERVAKESALQFAESRNGELEFRWIGKDKRVVWVRAHTIIVRDRDGKAIGVRGVVTDMTARKRAEEALQQSEILNRSLVEHLPQRIFVKDRNSVYLFCNAKYALDLGTGPIQVVGKDDFAFHPRDLAEGYRADDREVMADGKVKDIEERYKVAGEELWIHTIKIPYRDHQGEIIGVLGLFEDITARKRAEAQRERLAVVVEASPDFIGYADPKTTQIQYINKHGRKMCGIGEDEDVRKLKISDVHPAWMNKRLADVVLPAAVRDGLWEGEGAFLHRDGREIPVLMSLLARKAANGEVDLFYTISRDITERKRADDALRESEERYRDLVENAQDIIYSHDLQGNYTSSNKAGEEITGYTLAEWLKLNLAQTIAPEYVEKAREMLARKLAGEETTAYELELIAKDGHRVPVEVNTRLVMQNGVPVGVTGVAREITDRKRAEAELRRLAAVVEETADSVVITNKQGNIQYVNPAFERITGYTKEEALNQNPRFLKSGKTDPAVYKELWETITRGGVWTGQLINRRKDGTLFHERITISAIYDESHEIVNYVAVKQDISDLIQLEEQLRQSQKLEAIGQLAGGVAHDFNNLLTAINGYSSLALQRLEGDHPIKPYLEEVKKAGDRAANLTRQLLAFGRKQILQPLPLNLNSAVSDMNKMLRLLIGEDIQLTATLDPDVGKVMADPGQIEQVLVNLIVNARDAMPRGGHLTIETENVELDEEYGSKHFGVAPGKYVLLAVSDTGEGMSEEVRRRAFEPFFTTKEKGKGTGLGLSTVYGIVKQSGGNVWVYSEPGKGTTFKVYLPQVESETRGLAEKAAEATPRGGTETILLVEDEEVVRGLARRILEQAGYSVVEAGRADDALRFWEEHAAEIDLLLTDVVMPEMSGKELADRLKAQSPELKMLFMSGYTDEAIVHHGVLDSSVEFIEKPFTPAGLIQRVRDVLDLNGKSSNRRGPDSAG